MLQQITSRSYEYVVPALDKVHKHGLVLVDNAEALIDRFLPLPATESKEVDEEESSTILPRAIYLPFRVPARTIRIVAFKVGGVKEAIVVDAKWAVQLTQDQKAKLKAWIAHRSRETMDRVSSSTAVVALKQRKSDAARKLQIARQSISDGQRAVAVRVYIVCERLRIIEFKDLTIEKVEALQKYATSLAKSATQIAYSATGRIAGSDRAAIVFERIAQKIPIVKAALVPEEPEGSTGALEADTQMPASQEDEGGTGAGADTGSTPRRMIAEAVAKSDPAPQIHAQEVADIQREIEEKELTPDEDAAAGQPPQEGWAPGTWEDGRSGVTEEESSIDIAEQDHSCNSTHSYVSLAEAVTPEEVPPPVPEAAPEAAPEVVLEAAPDAKAPPPSPERSSSLRNLLGSLSPRSLTAPKSPAPTSEQVSSQKTPERATPPDEGKKMAWGVFGNSSTPPRAEEVVQQKPPPARPVQQPPVQQPVPQSWNNSWQNNNWSVEGTPPKGKGKGNKKKKQHDKNGGFGRQVTPPGGKGDWAKGGPAHP
eukprot:gnl/TRDRNA2_/TRDRNA2_151929_c2_seq2.p1 gnl/TRDRNA2_/TRDRNA2_151929_c2~~gnl/TRDRNA2_/TRDRNA2_151929_c2_seq2.p1  ORF type:complete len:538 (+),score=134.33 gnl/TRDRNA2_/TRDRNA2_151929_c2_seq2:75-1688(+)